MPIPRIGALLPYLLLILILLFQTARPAGDAGHMNEDSAPAWPRRRPVCAARCAAHHLAGGLAFALAASLAVLRLQPAGIRASWCRC